MTEINEPIIPLPPPLPRPEPQLPESDVVVGPPLDAPVEDGGIDTTPPGTGLEPGSGE
ncbi:hypothetical protein GCM10027294_25740 [Marinactinospora endophytica]